MGMDYRSAWHLQIGQSGNLKGSIDMKKNAFASVVEREPKTAPLTPAGTSSYPKHRQGKRALIGYFTPGVSKALRQMASRRGYDDAGLCLARRSTC